MSQRVAWVSMFSLLALYLAGFIVGWGNYASWHLLLVVVAILLLYNVMSKRGT